MRKENPEAKSIKQTEIIKISSGEEIKLGQRMHRMRTHLDKLTEEQKEFWKLYGLYEGRTTEEEYREAAKIWREENPNAKSIKIDDIIKIASGKKIKLGKRMNRMRIHLDKLTEEQKEFWKDYGLYEERGKQLQCMKKEKDSTTKKAQDRIVEIANQISKKYDISFSNLLFMFETVEEYELLDVGLEEDINKKIKKINQYHFDEFDIEESYFMGIAFKGNLLKEKNKEYLKRQELLRQYIIDWNYYKEEEKQQEINLQNLTLEELEFINRSREELDTLIIKLKKEY